MSAPRSRDEAIDWKRRPVLNAGYWDAVAADYDGKVLSVFDHDLEGVVVERIHAAASTGASAADLGCGVGKFTPELANAFARVAACDLSARAVTATRARCAALQNVTCYQLDLAADPVPFDPVDFALCVNVLIMPSLDVRMRMWRAVTNQVAHDGTLLLVVPAVESRHYENFRALESRLDDGHSCRAAIRYSLPEGDAAVDLHQGIHALDGLRTKHYLREELEWLLSHHAFDVVEVARVEYPWSSVYDDPIHGTDSPFPWDWLVMARRR